MVIESEHGTATYRGNEATYTDLGKGRYSINYIENGQRRNVIVGRGDFQIMRASEQRFLPSQNVSAPASATPAAGASAPVSSIYGEGVIGGSLPGRSSSSLNYTPNPDVVPLASSAKGTLYARREDIARARREATQRVAENRAAESIASEPGTLPAQFFSPVDPFGIETIGRTIGGAFYGQDAGNSIRSVRSQYGRYAVQEGKQGRTQEESFVRGASEFAAPSLILGAGVVAPGSGIIAKAASGSLVGLYGYQLADTVLEPTPSKVGQSIIGTAGLLGVGAARKISGRAKPPMPLEDPFLSTRIERGEHFFPKTVEQQLIAEDRVEPFLRGDATFGLRIKGIIPKETAAQRVASERETRDIFAETGGKFITIEDVYTAEGRRFGDIDIFTFREIKVTPKQKPATSFDTDVELPDFFTGRPTAKEARVPLSARTFTLRDIVEPRSDEGVVSSSSRQKVILKKPSIIDEQIQIPDFLQKPKNRIGPRFKQKTAARQNLAIGLDSELLFRTRPRSFAAQFPGSQIAPIQAGRLGIGLFTLPRQRQLTRTKTATQTKARQFSMTGQLPRLRLGTDTRSLQLDIAIGRMDLFTLPKTPPRNRNLFGGIANPRFPGKAARIRPPRRYTPSLEAVIYGDVRRGRTPTGLFSGFEARPIILSGRKRKRNKGR